MERRITFGIGGIGLLIISFICVFYAFVTSSWIASDYGIRDLSLERLGLWRQCFPPRFNNYNFNNNFNYNFNAYNPNPNINNYYNNYDRDIYVNCRWSFEPFTDSYDQFRGYNYNTTPAYIIATALFYTLCFIASLIGLAIVMLFFLRGNPEHKSIIRVFKSSGYLALAGGICGILAVIIFALNASGGRWLPRQVPGQTYFLGLSYILAVVGALGLIVSGVLFFLEAFVQHKDQKTTQTRFELDHSRGA